MTVERLAYSVPEAAEALGISERVVWDLIAKKELPSEKLGGRRVIPRVALEREIEARAAS